MSHAFVERHRDTWPIVIQCRVLQVSASGYHQHRLRQAADAGPNRSAVQPGRRLSDTALAVHIKAVFSEMKGAYGWPRIWRELAARGIRAGKERVCRMMKSLGLQGRGKRRFKATTNSAHDLPIAPNLLARNFTVDAPNKVWTGDITYIWTDEGWLYLAAVIDLFNRQVVGFTMGERMTRTLVMDALRMAWFRRHPQAKPDLPLGSRQSIRQQRLPPAPAGLQNGKLDEPQGRLLGQCGHRNVVRITEGRTAPRHALRHAAPC